MTYAAELKTRLIAEGVKTCIASYVDMHGVLKSKNVPVAHLNRMLAGSEMFTGAIYTRRFLREKRSAVNYAVYYA